MADITDCECPSTVLDTIPYNPCKNVLGKVKRVFFQVVETGNDFVDGVNGIELEASWTGLPDAVDSTKVTVTPPLKEVTFAEPDIIEGSENFDGAPTADASGPQLVTFVIENPDEDQVAAIDSLLCKQDNNLGVLFVDRNGKMRANKVDDTPTYSFIPVSEGTFIGKAPSRDPAFGSKYQYMVQFYLDGDWYKNSKVITPEAGFNPANDVKPS